ncbi:hypothetical protein DO021_12580 [Desulfobacter hydrogenophilus]|uniref:Uncharacterized protein n=1 Tax=Desulfobacter hydrogenophilus TaxID=2291 RepID=A0A328FAC4_9BACT|nr:hypothetical protein [Desulfobacter hydrogenophilus]NDY73343.1 hypothetical protein [Desulfobacter hydrogenophilus]QBH14052.1 hypothetical protein EYB58_14640 [Desulfobacter hydrogenophilus]RAM01614.1 hypothetical protein DO021_12580 [Desulfobacter hydrogenophilus]
MKIRRPGFFFFIQMKGKIKPGYNTFFNVDDIFCIHLVIEADGVQTQILTKGNITDLRVIDPKRDTVKSRR